MTGILQRSDNFQRSNLNASAVQAAILVSNLSIQLLRPLTLLVSRNKTLNIIIINGHLFLKPATALCSMQILMD